MPRVLYCASTCPPLEPPFPMPAAQKKPTTAHHGYADPNSPTSSLPDPSHQLYYEYESDSESECPPTPEPPSLDSEDYSYGDECFNPYFENCPRFANIALEHYNNQDRHEVKYQLIKPIVSSKITYDGSYCHVNFTAKTTLENSKEEFFFAELRRTDDGILVPVCIVSMEEHEGVGGFSEIIAKGGVDPQHCFGCGDVVKHPVDGYLYEAGHYLVDDYFFHRYIEVLPAT